METPKRLDPFRFLSYGQKKKPYSRYPTFNRRMLAVTVDSIVLLLALPLINRYAPINMDTLQNYTIDPQDPQASRHFLMYILGNQAFVQSWIQNFLLQMLSWCIYSAVCLHFWSATPGKMIFRMKVVDYKTEGRISDIQVFARSFGYLVSAVPLCLGFIWIGLNKKRRGWHDYLADTVVLDIPFNWRKQAPAPQAPEGMEEASPGAMPPVPAEDAP